MLAMKLDIKELGKDVICRYCKKNFVENDTVTAIGDMLFAHTDCYEDIEQRRKNEMCVYCDREGLFEEQKCDGNDNKFLNLPPH